MGDGDYVSIVSSTASYEVCHACHQVDVTDEDMMTCVVVLLQGGGCRRDRRVGRGCATKPQAPILLYHGWLARQRPAPSVVSCARPCRQAEAQAEARQGQASARKSKSTPWMKPQCSASSTSTAASTERHHCSGARRALAKLRSEPSTDPSQLQILGRTWHAARRVSTPPRRVSTPFAVGR